MAHPAHGPFVSSDSRQGTVIARHRETVTLQISAGEEQLALLKGRRLHPVVGDRVRWQATDDGTPLVTEVLSRDTELARTNRRGKREVIAANVSQLVVVTAATPAADSSLVDRYFGAAEIANMAGAIAFNKVDLGEPDDDLFAPYRQLGYPVFFTSARTGQGLTALGKGLEGHTSALVGQSGVGKSSLINGLLGEDRQATGALSHKSGHGRHVTTAARLFELPGGGRLIDSPGVRDYAPHLADVQQLDQAFPEIAQAAANCRFTNCSHEREPDCGVQAALSRGTVHQQRFNSYLRLRQLIGRLMDR